MNDKPDYQFSGEWPCVELRIPIALDGHATHVLRAITPEEAQRLLSELQAIVPQPEQPLAPQ